MIVASAEEKAITEGIRARATIHARDGIIRVAEWRRYDLRLDKSNERKNCSAIHPRSIEIGTE